jgi:hypothetical protein
MTKHVLLEKITELGGMWDRNQNHIVALPEEQWSDAANAQLKRSYRKAGEVCGLSPDDFSKHDHWGVQYSMLVPLGSVGERNAVLEERVYAFARSLADGADMDTQGLLNDGKRMAEVLKIADYEMLGGDVYVVRFRSQDAYFLEHNPAGVYSETFLVRPEEGPLDVQGTTLVLPSRPVESKNIAYFLNEGYTGKGYAGTLSVERIGDLRATRRSLSSFESRGRFGGHYDNPPCIVLEGMEFAHNLVEQLKLR